MKERRCSEIIADRSKISIQWKIKRGTEKEGKMAEMHFLSFAGSVELKPNSSRYFHVPTGSRHTAVTLLFPSVNTIGY
jgi:hypothetical protein